MKARFTIDLAVTVEVDIEKFCRMALECDYPDRSFFGMTEKESELDYALAVMAWAIEDTDAIEVFFPDPFVVDDVIGDEAALERVDVDEIQFRDFLRNSRPQRQNDGSKPTRLF